ncbi:MAG: sugar transferase [Acidobacteria bacterium]|nr:sugar transferase [Acidobacteriota bacterium]
MMVKVSNLYVPSRLLLVAGIDIVVASMASFVLLRAGQWEAQNIQQGALLPLGVALSVGVYLFCFYLFGLYDLDVSYSVQQTLIRSLKAVSTGILLLIPVWYWAHAGDRGVVDIDIYLLIFIVLLGCYRYGTGWLHNHIFPKQRVLLVGSGPGIQLLIGALEERKSLDLRLGGIVSSKAKEFSSNISFAICGTLADLSTIAASYGVDRVAVCSELHSASLPAADLLDLRRSGVHIDDAVALYERITGRIPVKLIRAAQMSFGKGFAPSHVWGVISRALSALAAAVALILTVPIFLAVSLLIKMDSQGPVFYMQERVGLNGKVFLTIKFRSMRTDAETLTGPVWASDHDPRVTRVGRILRTLRLDELPQLWNVLRGDMNLIGPRPERPHFVSALKQQIPYYDLRHCIPPGITGWAQVSAGYGATVEESEQKLEYDLFYVKNRSICLDAAIVVKTIRIMISGKGAR